MSVEIKDKLKLRPSVAVVAHSDITEFFLSNIRKSISLKVDPLISNLLFELDGTQVLEEWFEKNSIEDDDQKDFLNLLSFLNENHILLSVDESYSENHKIYPRVFTLLEDYFSAQSEVNRAFERLHDAKVLIIGLGAVGTWVAECLLMSGVNHLILVDADNVELSNLHRQSGFRERDLGRNKAQTLSERLMEMDAKANIQCIEDWLDSSFFQRHSFDKLGLIINCADYPTVDETSKIIGEYGMKHGIPHIIGGGYNLHQSLIGQVVLPGQTACLECFRMNLDDLNEIDTSNITKLEKRDRKIGSFPPLSALSASITGNEAFKVLAGLKNLVMNNHRTEFLLRDLNFTNVEMGRRTDCKWCGYEGQYYQLHRDKNE